MIRHVEGGWGNGRLLAAEQGKFNAAIYNEVFMKVIDLPMPLLLRILI
jgi:hypothetical protein